MTDKTDNFDYEWSAKVHGQDWPRSDRFPGEDSTVVVHDTRGLIRHRDPARQSYEHAPGVEGESSEGGGQAPGWDTIHGQDGPKS